MLFKINLNKQIQRNFYSKTFVMYTYSFNFASVTNQQAVAKGIKMAVRLFAVLSNPNPLQI